VYFASYCRELHFAVLLFTPFVHVGGEFEVPVYYLHLKCAAVHLDIIEGNFVLFLFSIY
jgi:hypothetical protein